VEERLVRFRASTILAILGIAIAVGLLLEVIWISRHVLVWILIAVFLALALNPAVEWFQRHGLKRRGAAAAVTLLAALGAIALLAALFVPTLVHEVNGFAHALPGYVDDVTHRRGRLGFLESKYHITQRVRDAVESGGTSKVLGLTGTAIAVTKGIIPALVAVALGLLVAILDLIPLAGATIAAIIVAAVGFIHSLVAGIVLIVFFIVYQQIENHVLQPVVYSRTVQLSPLAILISILVGAELAGVLGALAAIPVAGTIQVVLVATLERRRSRKAAAAATI